MIVMLCHIEAAEKQTAVSHGTDVLMMDEEPAAASLEESHDMRSQLQYLWKTDRASTAASHGTDVLIMVEEPAAVSMEESHDINYSINLCMGRPRLY